MQKPRLHESSPGSGSRRGPSSASTRSRRGPAPTTGPLLEAREVDAETTLSAFSEPLAEREIYVETHRLSGTDIVDRIVQAVDGWRER
jgi:hypothetical protein